MSHFGNLPAHEPETPPIMIIRGRTWLIHELIYLELTREALCFQTRRLMEHPAP